MGDMTEFKRCSCQTSWASRKEFTLDPNVLPIGITFPPDGSSLHAYYFFNHTTCKTTLTVDSEDFADLIEVPIPSVTKAGGVECEGHCAKREDMEMCSVECRNAPFRRFFVERLLKKNV